MDNITEKLKKLSQMRDSNIIVFEKNKRKYSKQSNSTNLDSYSDFE